MSTAVETTAAISSTTATAAIGNTTAASRRRGWLARLRPDADTAIAVLTGLAVVLLLATTASAGFVRDEGYYFKAAREYHAWFEGLWQALWDGHPSSAFSDASLRRAFGYNWEHPGFVKILMGWTGKIFHTWLGLVRESTGYRLGSILLVGVGAAFTYLFGARLFGRAVGLVAVLLLFACPHVFYHAHLAAFDGPITGLTVVATYAFWRSLRSRAWVIGAGLTWGLALATKHNAAFLIPTFALAYAIAERRSFGVRFGSSGSGVSAGSSSSSSSAGSGGGAGSGGLVLPPLPLAFVAIALLGPLVLYLFYPLGWHAPFARLGAYYGYHLHHEHYPVDYFGALLTEPPFPWSFPYVMSAITIPLPILVAGLAGLVALVWRAVRALGRNIDVDAEQRQGLWLLIVSALVPPFIIAIPSVPIFGGTKHWMPMMPFFCLMAAWTVCRAAREVSSRLGRAGRPLGVALGACVLLVGALETARTHPFGQTYFNELVLGHQGAAALGMPRTFWGGGSGSLLPTLNRLAARGDALFTHRMNYDSFRAYQRDGLLRDDVRWATDQAKAQWALVDHQREYQEAEYRIWALNKSRRAMEQLTFDNVVIVSLYRMPPSPAAEPSVPPPAALETTEP